MSRKTVKFKNCICGKRGFNDRRAADRVVGRQEHKLNRHAGPGGKGQVRQRYYECEESGLLHVTRMAKSDYRKIA